MTLSGTRGVVRVSKNRECELQAAMVVERVREPDFYRRMTGVEFPGEYGERQSARRRGSKFENNLHMNDAALLRQALAPLFGYEAEEMRVRNFEDEVPGVREGIRAQRLARMNRILRDLAEGREVPHLLIQPQLQLPAGPDEDGFFYYVGPDFLVFDPHAGMYVPGEEKSFIVRQGEADAGDLELTRRQAAAQILALQFESGRVGLGERVTERAAFVMATPYGLRPAEPVLETLAGEIFAVEQALAVIAGARRRLGSLREKMGDTTLENLAEELDINYQESCVGSCVMAGVCREGIERRAASLGDAAKDVCGPEITTRKLVELAGGARPTNDREAELADQLRDAADVLGLDFAAGGKQR